MYREASRYCFILRIGLLFSARHFSTKRIWSAFSFIKRLRTVLGYDNETCTFRWIWENIDHFDASKFNFVVTDWDNVLGTKGYRVLDNVFYNDKHADDEEWLNPSGFTLMDPIVIDLEDVRREIEEELKGTADYGR